jgi:hypothetical protein
MPAHRPPTKQKTTIDNRNDEFRVWWAGRLPALVAGSPEARVLTAPLAVYVLGRNSHIFYLTQRIIQDSGTSAGLGLDALLSPLREAERAIDLLAGRVDAVHLGSLRDTLRRMRLFSANLCQKTELPDPERSVGANTCALPGSRRWQRFRWLCRGTFPNGTVAGGLLALGEAVGKAILRSYRDSGRSGPKEEPGQTDSCLPGIVEAATALPEEYAGEVPVLSEMVRLAPRLGGCGAGDFLRHAILHPGIKEVRLESESTRVKLRYRDLLVELDVEIERGLAKVTVLTYPPAGLGSRARRPDETRLSKPGYLGLRLLANEREVRRKGFNSVVKLAGREKLWQMMARLVQNGETFCCKADLRREVWPDQVVENSTVYWTICALKKEIKPLGVTIRTIRAQGSRLEEEPRNRTGGRK